MNFSGILFEFPEFSGFFLIFDTLFRISIFRATIFTVAIFRKFSGIQKLIVPIFRLSIFSSTIFRILEHFFGIFLQFKYFFQYF